MLTPSACRTPRPAELCTARVAAVQQVGHSRILPEQAHAERDCGEGVFRVERAGVSVRVGVTLKGGATCRRLNQPRPRGNAVQRRVRPGKTCTVGLAAHQAAVDQHVHPVTPEAMAARVVIAVQGRAPWRTVTPASEAMPTLTTSRPAAAPASRASTTSEAGGRDGAVGGGALGVRVPRAVAARWWGGGGGGSRVGCAAAAAGAAG